MSPISGNEIHYSNLLGWKLISTIALISHTNVSTLLGCAFFTAPSCFCLVFTGWIVIIKSCFGWIIVFLKIEEKSQSWKEAQPYVMFLTGIFTLMMRNCLHEVYDHQLQVIVFTDGCTVYRACISEINQCTYALEPMMKSTHLC